MTLSYSTTCWGGEGDARVHDAVEVVLTAPGVVRIENLDIAAQYRCELFAQLRRTGMPPEDRIQIATEGHLKLKLQAEY